MRFCIKHEMKGRLRIHIIQNRMTYAEADTLSWYLEEQENVTEVKVYERTADAVICYKGEREEILTVLKQFSYEKAEVPETVLSSSGRQLNEEYKERLITKTVLHYGSKLFLPMPVRAVITSVKSVKYIWKGIRCLAHGRLEVPVLDATAISVSVFRKDFATAGSVMFLLGIGEIIEEWTHKKSVGDLARSMSLNVKKVWLKREDQEILVKSSEVQPGDEIIVHMGNVIPFDGEVSDGEGMVNQASLTGEAMPVEVYKGDKIYSGCINLSGVLEARVTRIYKDSIVSRIMETVEEAQNRKSQKEAFVTRFSKVYAPIMVLLSVLIMVIPPSTFSYGNWETWIYKGLIFIIVACPCALAVAAPLAFLGGIASAARQGIVVKGGNFLESLVKADTFIFDKTGTLTQGEFRVARIKAVGMTEEELLKLVAHVESYSNHPLAKSLADAYGKELDIDSVRSVKEKPGFGISATYEGQRVHVGSRRMMDAKKLLVDEINEPGTVVYVCVGREYAGYVLVQDQVKEEAKATLTWLKEKYRAILVMLTGDTEKTGRAVGRELHMDYVYTDLLPQDKLEQLEDFMSIQGEAEKLVCVGDGINDAPMLARADIGIAMGNLGSEAAIEAADVILVKDDLHGIVALMKIAKETLRSVSQNITFAVFVKILVLFMAVIGYFGMWEAILVEMVVVILAVINSAGVAGYTA